MDGWETMRWHLRGHILGRAGTWPGTSVNLYATGIPPVSERVEPCLDAVRTRAIPPRVMPMEVVLVGTGEILRISRRCR
ncbi:hypothetical protein N825_23825 [Skermanella stibiiresistens SB22]|uniref:Uncharacterized protein n=1 Tax=Skermanella stibiiresistens SB22 TaxID=1385369 RepID=W9H6G8_9PROT|nr:hypothetical protein N825_23825 [Skermanella stibiiresistens SB22]